MRDVHILSYSHYFFLFNLKNLLTTLNLQENLKWKKQREFGRLRERTEKTVTIFQSRKKVMCNLIASLRFQVFPLFFLSLLCWLQIHSTEWHGCAAWIVKLNLIFYAYAMDQSFEWHFIMRCHSIKYQILSSYFCVEGIFCWLFTFNKQMVFPHTTIKYWHFVWHLLFSLWNSWQHHKKIYAQPFEKGRWCIQATFDSSNIAWLSTKHRPIKRIAETATKIEEWKRCVRRA